MTIVCQAAQGLPGPHSYFVPNGKLAQSIPPREKESDHTARPARRIYAFSEAEYQRSRQANATRRAAQAERNRLEFGEGVSVIESMSLPLLENPRAFMPTDDGDDDGVHSGVAESAMEDWSWKPHRDKQLGENFQTYKPPRHPLEGIRF